MREMLGYEIEEKRVPCVYELSYKKGNPPCIVLRLHEEFVEANKDIVPLDFFIKIFQNEHGLGEFSSLANDFFGFNNAIKKIGRDSRGFIIYEIEIPVFQKESSELCDRCKGTGLEDDLYRKCLSCRGTKYKVSYDWKSLSAISASLHILCMILETFNKETSAKNHQLLTFQICCGKGQGRFPIGGHYGIDFCNWLNSLGNHNHQFDEVIKEMENVYSHIYKNEEGYGFQAYIGKGSWLVISVPGDACGIFPEGGWEVGKGREYSCHKMEKP
jgi:hypothetical protein